jgi:hypothetical protein
MHAFLASTEQSKIFIKIKFIGILSMAFILVLFFVFLTNVKNNLKIYFSTFPDKTDSTFKQNVTYCS